MQIAIDSYCYHRCFGEIYPGLETDPGYRMSLADVVDRAVALGVQGVSLESFMLDETQIASLRSRLDRAGLARVWAWGHPRGLESGTAPATLTDLKRHVDIARALGATVMRICAGGRRTRTLPWAEHRALLLPLLAAAADYAQARGVVLAIENHIDLLADEMLDLLTTLDHPALGVCFDTANNLRMFEDPLVVAEKLAPYARATHVKDITAFRGSPRDFSFWPSVPLGTGLVPLAPILALLQQAGYDGLLAIEIDYLHPNYTDLDTALAESVAYMHDVTAGLTRPVRGSAATPTA